MATASSNNVKSAYGSGNAPLMTPPIPLAAQITGGISTTLGVIGLVNMWANNLKGLATTVAGIPSTVSAFGLKGVQASISAVMNIPAVRIAFGAVGVGLGAYSLSQTSLGVYKNGITLGGAANLGMGVFGVATGVNTILGPALLSNPVGWIAAGGVLAGSFTYASINDMVTHGVSAAGVATAVVGTAGVAIAASVVAMTITLAAMGVAITGFTTMAILAAALTNPIGWVVAGAVVLFSVLWSVFHQPPPEVAAMTDMVKKIIPLVWSAGPVLLVPVGTAAVLMNWSHTRPTSVMSTITRPTWNLSTALAGARGGPGTPSTPLFPQSTTGPTVLVEPGTGDTPTQLIIVSPAGSDDRGRALSTFTSYTLPNSLGIQSMYDPAQSFIPFFKYVNGVPQPNQDALDALMKQNATLKAVLSGYSSPMDALRMLALAAASNKFGASPVALN